MRRFAAATVATATLLCACENGTVTFSVADAPIDGASQVQVTFTGIDLIESDGSTHSFDLDQAKQVNLLGSTSTQLLGKVTAPAGDYTGITLHISATESNGDSFVKYLATAPNNAGDTLVLALPDDDVDGVTVPANFTVARLRDTGLTADIDLRRAIVDENNGSSLTLDLSGALTNTDRTNVHVVEDDEVGRLTGKVAASLINASSNCAPAAIYVYEGANADPGEIGGSTGQEPITSTTLGIPSTSSGLISYTIDFLDPGHYTVALICKASLDDPTKDDGGFDPIFQDDDVEITAGESTAVDSFQ